MTRERRPWIWLVRHGETEWSRSGRHTGRTDVPLTDTGEQEAAALRGRLSGHRFALVLSSPLSRAWRTCELAGHGALARPTDDLLEWDYGEYEGRTTPEIRREVPGWSIWTHPVPGGESIEEVARRTSRVIAQATLAEGDVLAVAHGHVLRVLAACWLGLPPGEGRLLPLATASIGVLGFEGENRVLQAWNDAALAEG